MSKTLPELDTASAGNVLDIILTRQNGDTIDKSITVDLLPISALTQTALNAKEGTVTAGTTSQYYRGDKSFETLNLGAVAFDVNAQTGTTYTLLDSDHGKLVTLSNASAITLTVPSGLRSDFYCSISQIGAGLVSTAVSGATLNNFDSHTDLAGQYAMASIIGLGSNAFLLQGRTA